MDPLNKAEEIASAWKALAGNSRGDESWMTIPVSLKSSCKLLAGRHHPGNEEAVLVGFSSFQMPTKGQLPTLTPWQSWTVSQSPPAAPLSSQAGEEDGDE